LILLIPAFFVALSFLVRFKTILPKAVFLSLLGLSIYLSVGIYIPTMVWLFDSRSHLKQITCIDENGKPLSGVGIKLQSSYTIGNVDFGHEEYRLEAYLSDADGKVSINNHKKPLPIFLIPFLIRFYDGTGYLAYKSGYYPITSKSNYSPSTEVITLKKVTDRKQLYQLMRESHYSHYDDISNFINVRSAENYMIIYRQLMQDAQQIHDYDEGNIIANSYKHEYQRIVDEFKLVGTPSTKWKSRGY